MSSAIQRLSGVLVMSAAALTSLSATAAGPTIDTMARIKETRTITLGVRETSRPFSFVNEQKQGQGYTVELCLAAVDEIKKERKLPELKVEYVVVSGADRIPKLQKGDIDLE